MYCDLKYVFGEKINSMTDYFFELKIIDGILLLPSGDGTKWGRRLVFLRVEWISVTPVSQLKIIH